jgi:hypothetical protein
VADVAVAVDEEEAFREAVAATRGRPAAAASRDLREAAATRVRLGAIPALPVAEARRDHQAGKSHVHRNLPPAVRRARAVAVYPRLRRNDLRTANGRRRGVAVRRSFHPAIALAPRSGHRNGRPNLARVQARRNVRPNRQRGSRPRSVLRSSRPSLARV